MRRAVRLNSSPLVLLALNSPTKPVYRSSGKPGFASAVNDDPRHIVARKIESKVHVRFADEPCTVQTLEGLVHAKAGDAVITGANGERWRVSSGHFAQKYLPLPPTASGECGVYTSLPYAIQALQMTQDFDVWLADGISCLSGHAGDWLVDYGDGSLGVVARSLFAETYEIVD